MSYKDFRDAKWRAEEHPCQKPLGRMTRAQITVVIDEYAASAFTAGQRTERASDDGPEREPVRDEPEREEDPGDPDPGRGDDDDEVREAS